MTQSEMRYLTSNFFLNEDYKKKDIKEMNHVY